MKDRGRWVADSSVRRYEKAALILRQRDLMPQDTIRYGERVYLHRAEIFATLAAEINEAATIAQLNQALMGTFLGDHITQLNTMLSANLNMHKLVMRLKLQPPRR